jgi:hypothetical protein
MGADRFRMGDDALPTLNKRFGLNAAIELRTGL